MAVARGTQPAAVGRRKAAWEATGWVAAAWEAAGWVVARPVARAAAVASHGVRAAVKGAGLTARAWAAMWAAARLVVVAAGCVGPPAVRAGAAYGWARPGAVRRP